MRASSLEPFLLTGRALPLQGVQSMAELLDLVQSLGLGAILAITILQLVRYNRQLKAETYLTVVQLYFELQGRYVDHPEINAEPDRPFFFFSSRRRHTISDRDWSSDVCSSD